MRSSLPVLVSLALASCGGQPISPPQPAASLVAAPAKSAPADAAPAATGRPTYGYPATRTEPVTETLFGTTFTDPYRWLEDGKSARVQEWVAAQDDFARKRLKALPGRDEIAARLKELYYVESAGIPVHAGHRYFFSKREAKQEKSVVYVRESKAGEPRVLIDPNTWSADGSESLGSWEESLDGKYIAYGRKSHNSDEAVLHVMDVATGKDLPRDLIEGAKYAHPSWTPKGDGFYYTWVPPADGKTVTVADRPGFAEVRFHTIGNDPGKDKVVHEKTGDPKEFVSGWISRDGHWLFFQVSHGWSATDLYFKDTRKGDKEPFHPLIVGKPYKYSCMAWKDRFYVRTDDGAPAGRIFRVSPAKPIRENWDEIVPERKDAILDAFNIVGGMLSLAYMKDVVSRIEMHDLDGKLVREVPMPALGSGSVLQGRPDEDEAYYSFTSFTYPTELYETSVKTGKTSLYYRFKIPADPSKYQVEQLFATSKDGTRVPYFVVRSKEFKADGSAPALLYGYGGFLAAIKPGFTSAALPWLERGGIYVVANLRGGDEYGEDWHKAGMGHNKQNVFDDLFAIAAKLSAGKYTSPDKLVLRGGSNGGLLVAAAVTQRPDLFRVGLCGVPLIDMVRYHLFGSGKTWIEEYGSSENEPAFRALYAYSPYQHVEDGKHYPSLLLLSADSDDRVDPMHARKFAAMMQARSAGGPVLLRIEKNSGHGGADLIKSSVQRVADELAFALSEIAAPR